MLAVPGALVALGLAYLAALGTAERDRRDLALLRARGGSRRTLLVLAAVESAALGLVAGLLGAGLAVIATTALIAGGVPLTGARLGVAVAACVLLAGGGALAARLVAGRAASRPQRDRRDTPLWQRLYLDVLALVLSGLIYWLTARTGFSAVVNPDSNPTLSLSVYMFFAPALLWLGATLLLVRCAGGAVAWLAAHRRWPRPTTPAGFLLASAGRRGAPINRGLVLVGLLLAFGVNLGLFTATYDQQARVDAQLTLGADVVVTAPPGAVAAKRLARTIAAVPGVGSGERRRPLVRLRRARPPGHVRHRPADDRRGDEPPRLVLPRRSASSRCSPACARRPTGSSSRGRRSPTTRCSVGDLLRLRVLDRASGRFRVVPFHVVGIVQEFPSAPKDSFMVANLGYLRRCDPRRRSQRRLRTHVRRPRRRRRTRRSGDPKHRDARAQHQAADRADRQLDHDRRPRGHRADRERVRRDPRRQRRWASSSRSASPSDGTSSPRWPRSARRCARSRRSSGRRRRIVLGARLSLAAVLGWLLAEMLVAMLRHVFDPPPDALVDPLDVPRRARRRGPCGRRRCRGDRGTRRSARCRSARYCGSNDRASRHPAGGRRRASLDRSVAACARRDSRSRPQRARPSSLRQVDAGDADALVVDIGLPDADGRDVVQALRARGLSAPVIFLTARDALPDRLAGFAAGGDDYLTKPFALRRAGRATPGADQARRVGLGARGRRHAARPGKPRAPRAGRSVDADADRVPDPGAPGRGPGDAVRRRELVRAAWPHGAIVHDNTLDVYIARLRRKLATLARRAGDRDRSRRRLLHAMRRPRLGVRARLLLAVVAAVALALAVSVAAFTLLLSHRLSASATSLARAQAQAELSSLDVREGRLVAPEAADQGTRPGQVWVFSSGRQLEAPNAPARALGRSPGAGARPGASDERGRADAPLRAAGGRERHALRDGRRGRVARPVRGHRADRLRRRPDPRRAPARGRRVALALDARARTRAGLTHDC